MLVSDETAASRKGTCAFQHRRPRAASPAPCCLPGRQRQDRTQLRADAGGPAEGEGQAQKIGPEGRTAPVARIDTHLAVQDRDGEDAQKCSPKMMMTTPEMRASSNWFSSTKLPKALAVKPKSRKIVDRPSDEEQRGKDHLDAAAIRPPSRPMLEIPPI